jgi:hypothetical protein
MVLTSMIVAAPPGVNAQTDPGTDTADAIDAAPNSQPPSRDAVNRSATSS